MGLNNVDVEKLGKTVEAVKEDLSKAKKVNRIEGEWNVGKGAQFSAVVQFEGGKMTIEADQPTFLGGGGTVPGPMIYCLYGSASCYAATFATMAAVEGVAIKKLRIVAQSAVDFSRALGITENPIVDKVTFTLFVESDAPKETIVRLEELSKKRCPAVYCLTNPIPLETELKFL